MKSLTIAISITIIVIALSLYFVVDKDSVATTQTSSTEMQLGSVESMVGGLEERLQQHPDDGKGWLLLAKSYRHLGRMDAARDAYQKADELGNSDTTVAAQLYGLTITESSQ